MIATHTHKKNKKIKKHRYHKGKCSYAHIFASAPTQDSFDSYSSASSEAYCVQSNLTAKDNVG